MCLASISIVFGLYASERILWGLVLLDDLKQNVLSSTATFHNSYNFHMLYHYPFIFYSNQNWSFQYFLSDKHQPSKLFEGELLIITCTISKLKMVNAGQW